MYASYKENQYVHKNKGAFVTIEKSVLMYDMELWPQADYAGTSVSRIAYKVTLWENGEASPPTCNLKNCKKAGMFLSEFTAAYCGRRR